MSSFQSSCGGKFPCLDHQELVNTLSNKLSCLSHMAFLLRHESVFVVSYLWPAFFAEHDCHHVESKRAILDIVAGKKVACRPQHPVFLGGSDRRFGLAEILVRSGFYLDKDNCPIGIDHNQVDFARLTGEVPHEHFEALASQESLAAFLAPLAE